MIEIKLGCALLPYGIGRPYEHEPDRQERMDMMTRAMQTLLGLAATVFVIVPFVKPPQAQEKDLAAEGRALAEQHCARCHSVDKSGESKLPEAPPFRTFAAKWPVENLEEALAEGIVTGHPDMPVFQFEPDQIAALLEHLTAIAEGPKPQ